MLDHWPISEGYELRLAILSASGLLNSERVELSSRFEKLAVEPHKAGNSSDHFQIQWIDHKVVTFFKGKPIPVHPLRSHSFSMYLDALSGPIINFFCRKSTGSQFLKEILQHKVSEAVCELMFCEYKFHTSLPQNGKEYLRWMNWDASILASVIKHLTVRRVETLSFWTNHATITLPYLHPDDDEVSSEIFSIWSDIHPQYGLEVCVNGAAIASIDDLSLTLFSEKANLPHCLLEYIENISPEDDAQYAYIPENNINIIDALTQNSRYDLTSAKTLSTLAHKLSAMPLGNIELCYASFTRTLAYLWLAFHEEAHLNLGHIDLIPFKDSEPDNIFKHEDFLRLYETGKRVLFRHSDYESPEEVDYHLRVEAAVSQILELQADTSGFLELLSLISNSDVKDNLSNNQEISHTLCTHAFLDSTAIILFFLKAISRRTEILYATHPPAESRIICVMVSLFRALNNKAPNLFLPVWNDIIESLTNLNSPISMQLVSHRDEYIRQIVKKVSFLEKNIQKNFSNTPNFESLIHDIIYLSDTDDSIEDALRKVKTVDARWLLFLRMGMKGEVEKWLLKKKIAFSVYIAYGDVMDRLH